MRQLQALNPEIVVALGKQAGEAMGELTDLTMPHPHAVLKHGDKGEVFRKASMLREACLCRVQIADAVRDFSERRYAAPFSRLMWRDAWSTV